MSMTFNGENIRSKRMNQKTWPGVVRNSKLKNRFKARKHFYRF